MFHAYSDVIVDWHTGDYVLDQIYANSFTCPDLNYMQGIAEQSSEFISWNNSAANTKLVESLDGIFGTGIWTWSNALDCVMTAVCTGRQIPNGSGKYVRCPHSVFLFLSIPIYSYFI